MEGLLYEPRSLWSTVNATVEGGTAHTTRRQLNRQHFTNRTRWPMTLRRLAVSGINYTFQQPINAFDTGAQFWKQSTDIVQELEVTISAPQRYTWNSKRVLNLATMTPRSTWDPPNAGYVQVAPDTAESVISALTNTSQLVYDHPLIIPRTGALEWQLSTFSPIVLATPANVDSQAPSADAVRVAMLYQELGGMFFGSARVHQFFAHAFASPTSPPSPGNPFAEPIEGWPFPPDLAAALAAYIIPGGIPNWWDPAGLFSAAAFKRQNATRDGSTQLTDMRVAINQRAYDVELATKFDAVFPGDRTTQIIAPLSTRMGTRVKTVGCGSQAEWWRPGAPLCLVFDAKTPALVYDLPEQITLEPGDTLNVEITLPQNVATFGVEPPETQTVPFHVGVALNGFSPIEG